MSDDQVEGGPINHPAHYNQGGIEVIDVIEAYGLGFHFGNVVKYVLRADHKSKRVEDLRKARWYLDRAIKNAEQDGAPFADLPERQELAALASQLDHPVWRCAAHDLTGACDDGSLRAHERSHHGGQVITVTLGGRFRDDIDSGPAREEPPS